MAYTDVHIHNPASTGKRNMLGSIRWMAILIIVKCDGVLIRRSLGEYPLATCIDNTPASFYHTPDNSKAEKFVIYLNGGGYCPGVEPCKLRCNLAPQLCTSPTQPVRYQYGVLSDDPATNAAFHDWYKVDVPYCTGDMFTGHRQGSPETEGMAFAGYHVLNAVISSLVADGIQSAAEVVLTGSSAGGAGVVFNCDRLARRLPGIRVRCVVDAAFMYPLSGPLTNQSSCQTIHDILKIGTDLWRAPEIAGYPLNSWWERISSPLFIGNALYDEFGFDIFCGDRKNSGNLTSWAMEVTLMVGEIMSTKPDSGFFIPGCFSHMMLTNDVMFGELKVGPEQITYSESLKAWMSNRQQLFPVIDKCPLGIPCNDRCESIY